MKGVSVFFRLRDDEIEGNADYCGKCNPAELERKVVSYTELKYSAADSYYHYYGRDCKISFVFVIYTAFNDCAKSA